MKKQTFYTVWIRPVGSFTWTYLCFPWDHGTQFRTGDVDQANSVAVAHVQNTGECAVVLPISFPKEPDKAPYALLADGDTKFAKTED